MRDLNEVEVMEVSGGSFWHDVGAFAGDAYAWYEANAIAIGDGNNRGERP